MADFVNGHVLVYIIPNGTLVTLRGKGYEVVDSNTKPGEYDGSGLNVNFHTIYTLREIDDEAGYLDETGKSDIQVDSDTCDLGFI